MKIMISLYSIFRRKEKYFARIEKLSRFAIICDVFSQLRESRKERKGLPRDSRSSDPSGESGGYV